MSCSTKIITNCSAGLGESDGFSIKSEETDTSHHRYLWRADLRPKKIKEALQYISVTAAMPCW